MSDQLCECRNWACVDAFALAFLLVDGHHVHCSERNRKLTSAEIIEKLVNRLEDTEAERDRLRADVERLKGEGGTDHAR